MTDEQYKESVVERTVMVAADRVDALVSRSGFHAIDKAKALSCLKRCVSSAMLEMDHMHYEIKTRASTSQILVNIKLFEETDVDYDVQLKYSISE